MSELGVSTSSVSNDVLLARDVNGYNSKFVDPFLFFEFLDEFEKLEFPESLVDYRYGSGVVASDKDSFVVPVIPFHGG